MKDLYNPDKKSMYLQYLDANNLYGWGMVQNLPTHGLKWKNGEDLIPEKIDNIVKKDERGYENHNELSFLVDKMKIGREEKLVPNLKDKKGYVVHIKALDQVLKYGLKLEKVHRVIEFQQSRWMKAC